MIHDDGVNQQVSLRMLSAQISRAQPVVQAINHPCWWTVKRRLGTLRARRCSRLDERTSHLSAPEAQARCRRRSSHRTPQSRTAHWRSTVRPEIDRPNLSVSKPLRAKLVAMTHDGIRAKIRELELGRQVSYFCSPSS